MRIFNKDLEDRTDVVLHQLTGIVLEEYSFYLRVPNKITEYLEEVIKDVVNENASVCIDKYYLYNLDKTIFVTDDISIVNNPKSFADIFKNEPTVQYNLLQTTGLFKCLLETIMNNPFEDLSLSIDDNIYPLKYKVDNVLENKLSILRDELSKQTEYYKDKLKNKDNYIRRLQEEIENNTPVINDERSQKIADRFYHTLSYIMDNSPNQELKDTIIILKNELFSKNIIDRNQCYHDITIDDVCKKCGDRYKLSHRRVLKSNITRFKRYIMYYSYNKNNMYICKEYIDQIQSIINNNEDGMSIQ